MGGRFEGGTAAVTFDSVEVLLDYSGNSLAEASPIRAAIPTISRRCGWVVGGGTWLQVGPF